MRKKYLSALLFGALVFASAGTFTSCKDYDDDISNLQSQITANADAIKALQELVNNGDYVTGVKKSEDGKSIVFTFSKSGEKVIEVGGTSQEGDVLTIDPETGELLKNNEPTGIKPATDPQKPSIIMGEDGCWQTLQEDGTYKTTNIPVSGVSVVGSEKDGYTMTIVDANGDKKEVKIPSATSRITDLITEYSDLLIAQYTFNYTGDASKWKGPKKLPAKGSAIVSANNTVGLQVNPTNIDATEVEFKLVDSNNNYPTNVTLSAKEDKKLITREAYGNGMYQLVMDDAVFAKKADADKFMAQFETAVDEQNKGIAYAVAAGKVRTEYVVGVAQGTTGTLANLLVKGWKGNKTETIAIGNAVTKNFEVDLNTWYYFEPTSDELGAFYDMYVSADKDASVLYGLEFKNEEGTYAFRATKTPDNITKDGFAINVETVDKNGNHKSTEVTFKLSDKINEGVEYDAISHEIKTEADKNFFSVDLAKMKEALGTEGLALWNTKVKGMTVSFYDADNKLVGGETTGIAADGYKVVDGKNVKVEDSDLKNATHMMFSINNATAAENYAIGKSYKAVVEFKDGNNVLNTITVPFTLTLPEMSTLFQLDQKFVVNNVAACYLYKVDSQNGSATFNLNRVFAKKVDGFNVTLDNKTKIVGDKTSAQLAEMEAGNIFAKEHTYITLTGEQNKDTGLHAGYGKDLILNVKGTFEGWSYPEGKNVYTFKVKVMSPIYEGNVVPKEGTSVTIPATDLNGYEFGNKDIIGNTYNTTVQYNVLPDAYVDGKKCAWKREEIKSVTGKSSNERIFTVANDGEAKPVSKVGTEDKPVYKDGYLLLNAKNVPASVTESIDITVTDIWGYKKTSKVNINITVNE